MTNLFLKFVRQATVHDCSQPHSSLYACSPSTCSKRMMVIKMEIVLGWFEWEQDACSWQWYYRSANLQKEAKITPPLPTDHHLHECFRCVDDCHCFPFRPHDMIHLWPSTTTLRLQMFGAHQLRYKLLTKGKENIFDVICIYDEFVL